MGKFWGNVLKSTVILGMVGVLLALAAPLIPMAIPSLLPAIAAGAGYGTYAAALGLSANPVWLGAFFGAFGALDAAIRPGVDGFVKNFKEGHQERDAGIKAEELARAVNMQQETTPQFTKMIEQERTQKSNERAV